MADNAFQTFERAVHDRLAPTYRDLFEPVTALAVEALLGAAGVRAGGRHGDLASGSGVAALGAVDRGAEVEAFDLSPAMVEVIRRRSPSIRATVGAVEDLPVEDGTFDTLTMGFGIGHLPDPEKAVVEARRILKPGGRIALSWWGGKDDNRVNGLFVDVIGDLGLSAPPEQLPPGPPIFRFSEPKALVDLLEEAGFTDICLETLKTYHHVPDAEHWWQIGLGAFARVSAILGAQAEEVRAMARQTFVERADAYRWGDSIAIPIMIHVVSGSRPDGQATSGQEL
jgi:SAM-dependent methyltransferase